MKIHLLALSACFSIVVPTFPAAALPIAPAQPTVSAEPILVSQACRRGWHYNWRWQRCVRSWAT